MTDFFNKGLLGTGFNKAILQHSEQVHALCALNSFNIKADGGHSSCVTVAQGLFTEKRSVDVVIIKD